MPAAVFNSEGRAADCLEKRLKALAALPVDRRPSIDLESAMLHTRAVFWCHGCNTNSCKRSGNCAESSNHHNVQVSPISITNGLPTFKRFSLTKPVYGTTKTDHSALPYILQVVEKCYNCNHNHPPSRCNSPHSLSRPNFTESTLPTRGARKRLSVLLRNVGWARRRGKGTPRVCLRDASL